LAAVSALDTGVLIEYIDELGDFHVQASAVLESVTLGRLTAIIPHPVFAELYYVSYRIFEKVDKSGDGKSTGGSPESTAAKLVSWLYRSPNIFVPDNTAELAIEAGKIKQKFSLAIPDSYVIASAKLNQCEAVFRSKEAEMKRGNNKLGRLGSEAKVIFLEDFA
jgi:uncharacterized protein